MKNRTTPQPVQFVTVDMDNLKSQLAAAHRRNDAAHQRDEQTGLTTFSFEMFVSDDIDPDDVLGACIRGAEFVADELESSSDPDDRDASACVSDADDADDADGAATVGEDTLETALNALTTVAADCRKLAQEHPTAAAIFLKSAKEYAAAAEAIQTALEESS